MKLLIIYLIAINAAAFLLMLIDKQKAKKRKRRIPEKVLLSTTAIGGSFGTLMAMYAFRHKTRHKRFTVCVPLLLFVHFGLILYILE